MRDASSLVVESDDACGEANHWSYVDGPLLQRLWAAPHGDVAIALVVGVARVHDNKGTFPLLVR